MAILQVEPGLPDLIQYGVLGILAVAFTMGWLVSRVTYDAIVKDRDFYRDKLIPALQQFQRDTNEVASDLVAIHRDLEQTNKLLAEVLRELKRPTRSS